MKPAKNLRFQDVFSIGNINCYVILWNYALFSYYVMLETLFFLEKELVIYLH